MFVGVDAHIDPRAVTNSPKISEKTVRFAGAMWASPLTQSWRISEILWSGRKKSPNRFGWGQGCGIDGACRPGYEVRSHWISCTLSIAWGKEKVRRNGSGGKNIRIGLAYMPCSRKKSCACVQSARTFSSACASSMDGSSASAQIFRSSCTEASCEAFPAASSVSDRLLAKNPDTACRSSASNTSASPRLLLAYFTRRRARKSENRGSPAFFLRKPARVLAKPAVAC